MIDPGLEQEAERAYARVIWLVGFGGLVVTALLVVIAWLLIAPPLAPATQHPAVVPARPLEHGVLDRATGRVDA